MTEPLPQLNVPTGTSKFNTPAGNGFAQWFEAVKQGVDVLGVEVLNRAQVDAALRATAALAAAQAYADLTVITTHLGLDTDGTPAFIQGSITQRLATDTDGNPYFISA